jgi:hypothetical protein
MVFSKAYQQHWFAKGVVHHLHLPLILSAAQMMK